MSDRKELLTAAAEALARAAEACAAAGVRVTADWGVRAGDNVIEIVSQRVDDDLATLIAAETPIAIGDEVRIMDRHNTRKEPIARIGREWIYTTCNRYRIDSGHEPQPTNRSMHPHDLARVRRWLVKPARGAR